MQYIKGKKLSEHLDTLKQQKDVCRQIGNSISFLHDSGIIHGDLTTSNMILADKNKEVYLIGKNSVSAGASFLKTKISIPFPEAMSLIIEEVIAVLTSFFPSSTERFSLYFASRTP